MSKQSLVVLCALLTLCYLPAVEAKPVDYKKLKEEIKAELKEEMAKEEKTKPGWLGDKLQFSGQVRVRPEVRRNLTETVPAVPGQREEDLSVLLRTRLGVQFIPDDHVAFFIQVQDARNFAEEAASVPSLAGDDEGIDLHQGYIDLRKIGNSNWNVRVGRQEIALGDERLVGPVGWSNVGRSFDALLVNYDPENWRFTALAAITDKTGVSNLGDAQYFGGLYATWKKFPGGVLDGYYFILEDNDGATGVASGTGDTQSVHTIGTRISTKFENGFDVGAESAVQLGKFGSNNILAFAEHARLGYTFSPSWKPRVGIEYNFATGDNPSSSKYTKFNNLFPTNHNKYGFMDMASWSNLHDGVISLSAKPGKFLVSADYHLLMVDKNHSASDTFATFTGGPGIGKVAGHEIDLLGQWVMNQYFNLWVGYSHFIPGAFFKDQGMTSSADFFYAQASAQF